MDSNSVVCNGFFVIVSCHVTVCHVHYVMFCVQCFFSISVSCFLTDIGADSKRQY